jgi:exosome complex RNA-binding protein Rrp42 (RNase PH superfamily)
LSKALAYWRMSETLEKGLSDNEAKASLKLAISLDLKKTWVFADVMVLLFRST